MTNASLTLACLLVSSAPAQDVWVDPVLGDDASAGTQAEPLRTISAALARTDVTARLLPGEYSAASGETFPLLLEGFDSIRAEGDAETTRIVLPDAGGSLSYGSLQIAAEATIQGVTLEQEGTSTNAITIVNSPYSVYNHLVLQDSRVLGGATGVAGNANGRITIQGCEIAGQSGAAITTFRCSLALSDVTIRDATSGIQAASLGAPVHLERVSILDVAETAIYLYNWQYAYALEASIHDCLLAGHERGIHSDQGFVWNEVDVRGCTIVSDRGQGVVRDDSGGFIHVVDSIVAGHTLGDLQGVARFENSLAEYGALPAHRPGSLVGDPMFVDRAGGDFRLGWGSPCIDSAQPGFSRDLTGQPRVVDGNLDLAPAPDMGALEHRTLTGPESIRLGETVALELTGPLGGFSTVVISPAGYAAVGATTPYGRFFLKPGGSFRLPSVLTQGIAPTQLTTPPFTDPSLVGTRVGLQALTRSTDAPAGGAYSQPLLVRIDP
ncbi:hypothetical protein Poly30_49340 [Planctomycetes bacterium Poly30]|uniref:Uncharacterized protein n=1 Tax=Saltatorellus ferox TaxID=2528018 RepID=A0A518EZ64_9BACT|nr:hypothetical protein Poly30_49340 [Planctomycetes bacterium Poly30]